VTTGAVVGALGTPGLQSVLAAMVVAAGGVAFIAG
jgi:hypothetical protein